MKRASRKSGRTPATVDVIRRYMQAMADHDQQEWLVELMGPAPYWEYMVALHLRLTELEHLEAAVKELL